MPGPAVHYIVGTKLAGEIRKGLDHPTAHAVADNLEENAVYTALGTCGPDFLFFDIENWPIPVSTSRMINLYLEVSDTIQEFKTKIIECVPLIDELIELKERSATLGELEQTFNQISNHISAITAIIQAVLTTHVIEAVDIFSLLTHPIQAGDPYGNWWWFDTLHYRKSGSFAAELINKTSDDPKSPEHAYAIGYLSHIAADVVGHPYVNLISGGPYRNQAQRHKFVESFQDVWAFQHYAQFLPYPFNLNDDLVYSGLHYRFQFQDPDDPPKLPDSLKKLLAETMRDVYQGRFGSVRPSDIDNAYRLWYRWLKGATDTGTPPRPQPYSISGEIAEVWQQFLDNLSDIGDYIPDQYNSGGGGLWGFLKALAAAILAPLLLGLAIIDFLGGMLLTISTSGLRYFMSITYEALYNSFEKYRFAVALNGLAFPLKEHLYSTTPDVRHTYNPNIPDNEGRFIQPNHFPKFKWQSPYSDFPSHIVHPQSADELVNTTGGPDSYLTVNPSKYIDGDVNFDTTILRWLVQDFNWDVNNLDILHNRMGEECLGNAVRLTKELYKTFLEEYVENKYQPIPNFNLDADRGIAYRSFRHDDNENPIKPLMADYTVPSTDVKVKIRFV